MNIFYSVFMQPFQIMTANTIVHLYVCVRFSVCGIMCVRRYVYFVTDNLIWITLEARRNLIGKLNKMLCITLHVENERKTQMSDGL